MAARTVFAETGYHSATVDAIAREGGYSKGAVYSNFSGKADLFLAVMDGNMEASFGEEGWDLPTPSDEDESACEPLPEHFDEALQGMALATLEFIAAAARDPELRERMSALLGRLIEGYAATAHRAHDEPGDPLSPAERGALLAALDQGTALLMLSGSDVIDQRVLRTGMQRLLKPDVSETPREGAPGAPALHDTTVQQRIAAALGAEEADGIAMEG